MRLAGVIQFSIDGINYDVVGGLAYETGGFMREPITDYSGPKGHYVERPTPGMMRATIRATPDVSLRTFQDMTDVTVIARLANGKTVSGAGMFTVQALQIDAVEAQMEVTWNGAQVEES